MKNLGFPPVVPENPKEMAIYLRDGVGQAQSKEVEEYIKFENSSYQRIFVWLLARGTKGEIRSVVIFKEIALLKKPQLQFRKTFWLYET